jgi:type II secretory pathway pseudopilin PulG
MKKAIACRARGLTLIEITLVIAVLIGLISILFIGISAYREGQQRAKEAASSRLEQVQP